jgi:phosphohistidine phosphatase
MKTLHLIRHAKSSWSDSSLHDSERPLNARGRNACKLMAHPIVDAGCSFENVSCSMARRAQLTIEGLAAALPDRDIAWDVDDDLYTFGWQGLLRWIRQRNDNLNTVVLVGHNPAITDFSNVIGDGDISNVPTCGYVQLQLNADEWRQVGPSSGRIVTFLTPKMLEQSQ